MTPMMQATTSAQTARDPHFPRRIGIVVLLIISLLATAGARAWAYRRHQAVVYRNLPRPPAASRLAGLDTFALGLLLGGLRGPLVMILWSSSEHQKVEKQLEDIDTKIELIRMLQPEFDSVHLFQIWNKAYNLSVQMATLNNKYLTILDALDYAFAVNQDRPDNMNIMMAISDVYFTKLGNSEEKRYYIPRMLEETRPRPKLAQPRQGVRRIQHDPLVDERGFLLPHLLETRPTLIKAEHLGYDGAPLGYLRRYNTPEAGGFPYGVSPLTLAYNYSKRGAVIQQVTHQKHEHFGEGIIDSRAATHLRYWADQESHFALRTEIAALGKTVLQPDLANYPVTADVPPTAPFVGSPEQIRAAIGEGLFRFGRAAIVAEHSQEEYVRHIKDPRFAGELQQYRSDIESLSAFISLAKADRDYLALLALNNKLEPLTAASADPFADASKLRASAMAKYQEALAGYYRVLLIFWVEDTVAAAVYPKVVGRPVDQSTLADVDPVLYPKMYQAVQAYLKSSNIPDTHASIASDYYPLIERAEARLKHLQQ